MKLMLVRFLEQIFFPLGVLLGVFLEISYVADLSQEVKIIGSIQGEGVWAPGGRNKKTIDKRLLYS